MTAAICTVAKTVRVGDKAFTENETVGREMTVADVINELMKEKIFMEETGGGVTFSGGEPLQQADFLIEMLKDGEMLSSDCEERLEAAGFKKSTIKKAKKKAGVISKKKGFLWYWSLPMGDIPRE